MRPWHTDTVARLRTVSDRLNAHGVPAPGREDTLTIPGARVRPRSTTEDGGQADTTHRLRAPFDADIVHGDRIGWTDRRGRTLVFEVLGSPLPQDGHSGAGDHLLVELKASNV